MSAPTGIAVSEELSSAFAAALDVKEIRFLKVSIRNESLVPDGTYPATGTLEEDLDSLGSILDDNIPAYILAHLDDPPTEWLVIYYVPDSSKVRDKMLYAATRTTLTKSLGSAHFTDSIFATTKDDVTAESYTKHRLSLAAPKPMSAREKEIAEIKAAEREAGGRGYEGSRARASHIGDGVGLKWTDEAQDALRDIGTGAGGSLALISIDPTTETLVLSSVTECTFEQLGAALPPSEPAYAFFTWSQNTEFPSKRDIVFIYSCPSSSPVRHRMLYSSGANIVFLDAKGILSAANSPATFASRRIETSDPAELNENFVVSTVGLDTVSVKATPTAIVQEAEKKPFARPKGPGRKR